MREGFAILCMDIYIFYFTLMDYSRHVRGPGHLQADIENVFKQQSLLLKLSLHVEKAGLSGAIPIPFLTKWDVCRMLLFIAISCPPVFTHSDLYLWHFCKIRNPLEKLFSVHVNDFYFNFHFRKQTGHCLKRGELINLTKLTRTSHNSLMLKLSAPCCQRC